MSARRISIEVDEIRLEGFPAIARYRFADAFEQELGRLFAPCRLPDWMIDGASVSMELHPEDSAEQMGRALARSLYKAWSRAE